MSRTRTASSPSFDRFVDCTHVILGAQGAIAAFEPYADPVRGAVADGPCRRGVSFVASVLDVSADESHQRRCHHGNRLAVGAGWGDGSGAYREGPPWFDDSS